MRESNLHIETKLVKNDEKYIVSRFYGLVTGV